jgi:hypothetical protein
VVEQALAFTMIGSLAAAHGEQQRTESQETGVFQTQPPGFLESRFA